MAGLMLLFALLFVRWLLPGDTRGTGPWLLLVSVDGFRPDYFQQRRNLTANLQRWLFNETSSRRLMAAEYLLPQFPTKTFPNHYSIVTGLYPESHGIVSNQFYDPVYGETFSYHDDQSVSDGKWWAGGEPIWVTAKKQGKRSHVCFWPGSEAEIHGVRPDVWFPYSKAANMSTMDRIHLALSWYNSSTKATQWPHFGAMYFSLTDVEGHAHGPNSAAMNNSIQEIDQGLGYLLDHLDPRVNVLIVSDHGMTTLDPKQILYLDDFISASRFKMVDFSPIVSLRPILESDLDQLHQDLVNVSFNKPFKVYRRETTPERWHYRNNKRIAPIILVSDMHWSIQTRNVSWNESGTHGYDNQEPDMHATFLASGPLFNHQKLTSQFKNGLLPPVNNLDLYEMMARILKLKPAPNNGTAAGLETLLSVMNDI